MEKIKSTIGKAFIRENHYTHTCHNGPMCYGMFHGDELVGVCAFANPCSENVRSSVYGESRKSEVTELHRLFIQDGTKTNAESWFIARALKLLKRDKPDYTAVISFSDATEGHTGTIYQATNALYQGVTSRNWFYRDQEGRLRHPRQNTVNISWDQAQEWGWAREKREAKRRYLFLLGSPREKKRNRESLVKSVLDYPDLE